MSVSFLRFPSGQQVVLGLIFVVLTLLDPFGLSSSSDGASEQWLNRVFASGYEDVGQQQVVVVLIDDAYVQRNGTYWPLPYGEQSKLFKRLLAFNPKAVFVDLLYSHDHSAGDPEKGSQLLANVFERYQRRGIPLLLANTGQVRGEDGQANTIKALTDVSTPALVSWSKQGERYPLAISTPVGELETPALGLYRQYCRDRVCADLPPDTEHALGLPSMAVQWGLKLSADQSAVADVAKCAVSGGRFEEFWKHLSRAIFWKLGDDETPPICRYTLTLSASDLEVTDEDDLQLIKRLLAGRLVLVGAQITSAGDLVESPVNGMVPGVFLHAMALDNLITRGMAYDREPQKLGDSGVNWLDLVGIGLVGVIALFKALHTNAAEQVEERGWRTRLRVAVLSPMVSWLVILCLLWLLTQTLKANHITPINVLGLLMISLVLVGDALSALPKIIARRIKKGI